MAELNKMTVHALAEGLAEKRFSAVEIAQDCLDAVKNGDDKIHAFLKVDAEDILREAKASDERRAKGEARSEYDGIPVGIKDNIAVRNATVSCASQLLENVVSPYDATAVANLRKKGFIPFGRLNMDEFAMGSSCENSAFCKTANPRDITRVPGGSIRQPASFCGVVGLKPTYGRVSRYGLVAFASSLDQIGPLSKDVIDSGIILDAISGKDSHDSTCLPIEASESAAAALAGAQGKSLEGLTFGMPKEYYSGALAPGVAKVLDAAIEQVKAMGGKIVEVSLPHTKYAVAVYYIIATAEASANLARFDAVRYGKRIDGVDLIDTYFKSRGAGFGSEVIRRILLGTYVLSSGYYDAYYLKAQKVRTLIRKDFAEAYKQCDLLLTPVTPAAAFKFGEKSDPLQMYLSDIFTIALNLAGQCGISVPAGIDDATGMPVGIQFLGPELAENRLLKAAAAFEAVRG